LLAGLALIRVPSFNTIDVFERHTGATTWSWEVWRLWRFSEDVGTDTLFEANVYWTALVLFAAVAFGVWSRTWRLLDVTPAAGWSVPAPPPPMRSRSRISSTSDGASPGRSRRLRRCSHRARAIETAG
jgi:hypothetical protein